VPRFERRRKITEKQRWWCQNSGKVRPCARKTSPGLQKRRARGSRQRNLPGGGWGKGGTSLLYVMARNFLSWLTQTEKAKEEKIVRVAARFHDRARIGTMLQLRDWEMILNRTRGIGLQKGKKESHSLCCWEWTLGYPFGVFTGQGGRNSTTVKGGEP